MDYPNLHPNPGGRITTDRWRFPAASATMRVVNDFSPGCLGPTTRETRSMIRISAFADEISQDPVEQIDVLTRHGIRTSSSARSTGPTSST